jgi:PPP family 3-phenylpropionic acid transporter
MGQTITSAFLFAYAATLSLCAVAALGLPPLQPRSTHSFWHGMASVVADRAVVLVLLTAFLTSSNVSMMNNYFGIYLIEIGGDARLLGNASVLAAVSELPVMIFGARLLERLSSRRVLLIAIGAYIVRFGLYSIPPAPQWVLAVQLLHGVTFGAFLMASVTLIHQLAGRQRAATAQGVLAAVSGGFGAITGSLVGGALLDRIGAVGVVRIATLGMTLAFAVALWSTRERPVTAGQAVLQAEKKPGA